jgi:hypothetical protein
MNTPKSETVKMRLSEIRERCRELLEAPEAPPELRLQETDESATGSDPYNHSQ